MKFFESKEFLKLEKVSRSQVDQLLSNCNQTPAQVPRFKTITIKFKSYLPAVFYSQNFHVRLVFYLNQLDKPVFFEHEIEQTRLVTSDDSVLYEIAAKVKLPILSDGKSRIFYFYQLESYENGQYLNKPENLLKQDEFIRHIDTSIFFIKKKDSRDLKIPNYTIDEIDGILLFESIDNLFQIRKNVVEISFPILYLNDDAILKCSDQFVKLLSLFVNSYRSLVRLDSAYVNLIKEFLETEFYKCLHNVRQDVNTKSESTYHSLMAIFYLSRSFKLNIDLDEIFSLHDINTSSYFYNLKEFFKVEDLTFNFRDELKSFLIEKKSLSALIVYYHLKNYKRNFSRKKIDDILRSAKESKIFNSVEDLKKNFFHYENLVIEDPNLGAWLLYIYDPQPETLNELIRFKNFPAECFVFHLGYKLASEHHDEFDKLFKDKNLNTHINWFHQYFENLHFEERESNLREIINGLLNMLELMNNSFSKESDAIVNLIEIFIKISSNSAFFNNEEQNINIQNIRIFLKNWFRNEFNQNILVNFGLEQLSNEDMRSNQLLINIYKNFPQYLENWTNFPFKKFENQNEVKQNIKYFGMNNQHEIISKLRNIKFMDSILRDLFKEQIKNNQLTKSINFLVNFDFAHYLDDGYQIICLETISDCLVEKKSEKSLKNLCDLLSNPKLQHYMDYILKEFVKRVWPKSNELKFCIHEPFFLTLVSIFVEHSKKKQCNPFNLSSIFDLFKRLVNKYTELINQFVDGNVSLQDIELINSDQNGIVASLNDLIVENCDILRQNFGQNFVLNKQNKYLYFELRKIRTQERFLFNHYRTNVAKFNHFCLKFSLLAPKITILLNKQKCLDQLPESNIYLKNVCSFMKIDQIASDQNFISKITFFDGIDALLMKEIEKTIDYGQKYCILFDFIFNQSSHELNSLNSDLSLADLFVKSSQLTLEKISQLIETIGQGIIKLTELDRIFSEIFLNKRNLFCTELTYWIQFFKLDNCSIRIKQIELYVNFKNSYLAAVEISKIRQKLELTNEFKELDQILSISQSTYRNLILNHMDSNVEQTIQSLSGINQEEKLECLSAFTKSIHLVKWLRENTKNLSELKFLVDLASMSGTNDATYDRSLFARALKDSGTAYATLIYELNINVTFHDFMRQCEKVCSHQASDPSIVAKLLEVEEKVILLDEIKRMTGSVELSSIKEAKLINENGIFRIGLFQNNRGFDFLNNFDTKLDLDQIIWLERDSQMFSYSHLRKLQDVLMLIVPKNSLLSEENNEKSILDYFIQFLSGLQQLGHSYINLYEYSCRFFENFQIKIYSNSAKNAHLPIMEIKLASQNFTFSYPELNSLEALTMFCNLIDKTELEWSIFVSNKRDAYPLLNYFTLKQINFLCQSIESLSQDGQITKHNFEIIQNMLWNVNKNLSVEGIIKAHQDTLNQMSESEPMVTDKKCSGLSFEIFFSQQWKSFLAEQNSVTPKYITLKHFTSILSCLYEHKAEIIRKLPGFWTKTDEPNLISCPSNELMSVILSIYALTSHQPMPTNSEIMFCQSNTTIEQVENFIRLCFNSNGSMIFLMVNIQNLTYSVSNKAEKFIRDYIKKPKKFNLAFTCDFEKETQSVLASVYSKNRVRYLLIDQETLEDCIKRNLINDENKLLRLGNFDADNCTVRLILSQKSGNGKSTFVSHLTKRVKEKCEFNYKIIRIKSNTIDMDREIKKMIQIKKSMDENQHLDLSTIYHIDIAYEVFNNVEPYLFSLIFSSYMTHSNGLVWRRDSIKDYFLIEISPPIYTRNGKCLHSIIDMLPKIVLLTPNQYVYQLTNEVGSISHIQRPERLFSIIHKNDEYQRVCFYLELLNEYKIRTENLNRDFVTRDLITDEEADKKVKQLFDPTIHSNISELDCLKILLTIFEPVEPNWLEIRNFVTFLNSQLIIYEKSKILDQVKGLRRLCLALMVIVATNFGLPSLQSVELDGAEIKLESYNLNEQRRWENLINPYIILDSDGKQITFIGTHMDRFTKQFLNSNTLQPLTNLTSYFIPSISQSMFVELLKLKLRLYHNFNDDHRITKLKIMANIMSLDENKLYENDPDINYELALDNCLKMIAIYLRFSCKIPVVLMGETGCGKTSLIEFFSKFIKQDNNENLIHMKIHGGTTRNDIISYLEKAEKMSQENYLCLDENKKNKSITCILFFDEANTTEEIGLIKEIMCDGTCDGRAINFDHGLKVIAAVNPYKKHSDRMIEKLESAGLGFYVSSSDTREKLGHIPMRQLVYRVQPLPTSMLPLVWDFGQLEQSVEKVYIKQIISELCRNLRVEENQVQMIDLIQKSQKFMRDCQDECSFVSIRDIERIVAITKWFYSLKDIIFPRMDKVSKQFEQNIPSLTRSFILSLMVCYHSALYNNENRMQYRSLLMQNYTEKTSYDWVYNEIFNCQSVFFDEIVLSQKNIARNSALYENVFMMIVCIELRIPLFIVGKPGSSKSLAKSIVSRAMEGRNSKSYLFQNLKETYFINFQCSPLTTSEMILKAFEEAGKFQESTDPNLSVAVVNLDEIGLAEGSESMPLKVLHPLLESGVNLHEQQSQKVAVIGISNWALDPAKMNRGLLVSRGDPDIEELVLTAKGICAYDQLILNIIENYLENLAKAYLDVCQLAREFKREYFGLRDYYSLIKMIFYFCSKDKVLTWSKLEHAIRRNFGGLEIDCVQPFRNYLYPILGDKLSSSDPKCDSLSLVESALKEEYLESNSRYLLFLTENNSVIDIVLQLGQKCGLSMHNLSIIFSSSFRFDQEYTEICRNISLIKHSMEIGKTVVLLNAYNLYESLYDALNQYYYEFAGQKYVDLGLGTHRIKCLVHENFRLIIIAEREAVYDTKKFPIPLINRLEKHFLNADTILTSAQKSTCKIISDWIRENKLCIVGLHSDAVPSTVLSLSCENLDEQDMIQRSKKILLQCATPESVIRQKDKNLYNEYFYIQKHFSLRELINYHLTKTNNRSSLVQISSFSKSTIINLNLEALKIDLNVDLVDFCLLQSFDTQHQFVTKLNKFYSCEKNNGILLIQADLNLLNCDLISCARYYITEAHKSVKHDQSLLVIFVILMEKENKKFTTFQHDWSCYHLDELEEPGEHLPDFDMLNNLTLSQIMQQGLDNEERDMEVDGSRNFSNFSLLKKLCHKACSLIRDTNLTRTISRIDIFNQLCDNKYFVQSLTKRLISLQKEKEENYMPKKTASLLDNICQSTLDNLTLRRSCETYLINKVSPLVAFVLSQVDVYSNLDVLMFSLKNLSNQDWRFNLWLNIFNNESLLRIQYSDMRYEETTRERDFFDCHSDFVKKKLFDLQENLEPSLPFFWLLISQFNLLNSNLKTCLSTQTQIQMIPKLFALNPLYNLLNDLAIRDNSEILKFYVQDFLLMNCEIKSQKNLAILTEFLLQNVDNYEKLHTKLIMVHSFFHSVQSKCDMFCKFVNLLPGIENDFMSDSGDLELDACKQSIRQFKNEFCIQMDFAYLDKAYELCQLIGKLLSYREDGEIFEQYEALSALKYFMDMARKFVRDFEQLKEQNIELLRQSLNLFNQLSKDFNDSFIGQNINFKCQKSIKQIHEFIIHCDTEISNKLPKELSVVLKEYLGSFYLDIIDNICFESSFNRKPTSQCIEFILEVFTSSKIDSSFELNLTHRSQIIQIIYKNNSDIVKNQLNKWFQSKSFIGSDLFPMAEEVSILFLNCAFDGLINASIDSPIEQQLEKGVEICDELVKNEKMLSRTIAQKKGIRQSFEVQSLLLISKFKFCVSIFNKLIFNEQALNKVKHMQLFNDFNQKLKYLVEKTQSNTPTLINFLVKDLIRKYGSASVKYVMKNEDINWITPENLVGNNSTVIDRYVLLDEPYVLTKKKIFDCFSTRSIEHLQEVFNQKKTSEPYLCLALYQNVTILAKNMPDSISNLTSIFEPWLKSTFPIDTEIFMPLLNNSFSNLFKVNDENWSDIDLTVLLVQLKYSIIFSKLSIIEPLRIILIHPEKIQDFYIPTMPQDNLYDIKLAMQSTSATNKFYSCPNGHIYVIGDCGRPWIMDKCKSCGEVIGGEQHRLVEKNSLVDESIQDKTMKGYCVQNLCSRAENMRSLNMVGFFYERFLIDACMYLALGDNFQNKEKVMTGMSHKENDLAAFFLIRIKNDLSLLASELNLNMDEIFLLMHLSLKKILNLNNQSEKIQFSLETKIGRQKWEEKFYQIFFANLLEKLNNELTESNNKIRIGNQEFTSNENNQSTLYFMAYELIPSDPSNGVNLYENELFWKYRPDISFDLIAREFTKSQQNKNNYPILSKFIEINSKLDLLINLNLMMQMVNFFKTQFNKNIFKFKAKNRSIGDYLSMISMPKDWTIKKIEECVNSYQNIWNFVQPVIIEYVMLNHAFDMKTKLSYFLPTLNGDGFLSYVLIHYMAKIQNEMLEQCKIKLKNIPVKSAYLFENPLLLICFDKHSDLLRILQSNFSFNSKELKFQFPYEKIENQILDKYLHSKAQIDLNSIPIFEYSDEIAYFRTFKRLNDQVAQKSLGIEDQAEILDDFKNIGELSEALNTLRLIIDYAIVTSFGPDDSLGDFLKNIYSGSLLEQTESILKSKILQYGKLENLKVIWILLATKKSILSTNSGQDPFESLNDLFKKDSLVKLDLNMDRFSLISLTLILYQIMDYFLSAKKGDDIEIYSNTALKDMFDELELLDHVIMFDNYIIPSEFLRDQLNEEIKLDSIFSIWKQVCVQWK